VVDDIAFGGHEEDAMHREQMVTIPREADERPVPGCGEEARRQRSNDLRWRKHFGSLVTTPRIAAVGFCAATALGQRSMSDDTEHRQQQARRP
jgi:hypothetical protein